MLEVKPEYLQFTGTAILTRDYTDLKCRFMNYTVELPLQFMRLANQYTSSWKTLPVYPKNEILLSCNINLDGKNGLRLSIKNSDSSVFANLTWEGKDVNDKISRYASSMIGLPIRFQQFWHLSEYGGITINSETIPAMFTDQDIHKLNIISGYKDIWCARFVGEDNIGHITSITYDETGNVDAYTETWCGLPIGELDIHDKTHKMCPVCYRKWLVDTGYSQRELEFFDWKMKQIEN